ncbi:MAG: flagellar protein FlgN [Defluviitaleaceae bacterium]|nr:flagellar protein FlgN [Defluviitaleaceae bacterium]
MAGMITQLVAVMKEQIERHTELYGLSLEEKDAIVHNDIDQLQKLVNLKNMVISQNNRLEKQRVSLVGDIAEVLGLPDKDLSLSQLIELMAGKPEEEELKEVGMQLRDIVEKLKEINDLNRELLDSAIEFVEYSLNALRSTIAPEPPEYPAAKAKADGSGGASSFNAMR